jgi:hypothetical protein
MTVVANATFNLDLTEIVEEAFERCGSELRSGYDLKTARRSLNLLFADWANRGINLWTVEQGQIALEQGVNTYNLPIDTVDLLEHVIRTNPGVQNNQADLTITRISVSTYATIPNKLQQARPIQVWVNRQSGADYDGTSTTTPPVGVDYPKIVVWPTPDQGTQQNPYYTFVYWRLRRIHDAGNGVNTMDIPFRFLPCMIAGLAYYLSVKLPEAQQRIAMLKAQYDEAWQFAADEDREKAAVRFVPRRMFIT